MNKCPTKSFWLAFFIAIITAVGLIHINNKLGDSNDRIRLYQDSLKVVRLDNDNLLYEKTILTASNQQIRDMLGDKDKEIKKLESKLLYYADIDARLKIDSVFVSDTVFVDSCYRVNTKYISDYLTFDLSAVICDYRADFLISNITIPVKLNAVISKERSPEGLASSINALYIESNNPYLKIQDITVVRKETKEEKRKIKFYHGPQLGVGVMYGIRNGIDVGLYVGYGVGVEF